MKQLDISDKKDLVNVKMDDNQQVGGVIEKERCNASIQIYTGKRLIIGKKYQFYSAQPSLSSLYPIF